MTIGPAPMTSIDWRSARLGMMMRFDQDRHFHGEMPLHRRWESAPCFILSIFLLDSNLLCVMHSIEQVGKQSMTRFAVVSCFILFAASHVLSGRAMAQDNRTGFVFALGLSPGWGHISSQFDQSF